MSAAAARKREEAFPLPEEEVLSEGEESDNDLEVLHPDHVS
jgi:hypothetical protein